MGTTKRKEAVARREEILETTMSVLAYEGYASVTMRSIANRIGIHLATLQYYFPTKRDLLRSTIDKCIGLEVRKIEEITLDTKADPKELLRQAVIIHMKANLDPLVSRLFVSLWGMAAHVPEVEELLSERYEQDCESYAALMHRANPKLPKTVCENRSILLVAQLEGLGLFISPGKPRASKVKAIQRELLSLLDLAVSD